MSQTQRHIVLINALWHGIVAGVLAITAYVEELDIVWMLAAIAVMAFAISISAWFTRILNNQEPSLEQAQTLLALPTQLSRVSVYVWFVAALLYTLAHVEAHLFIGLYGALLISILGAVCATFSYYSSEWILRREVFPQALEILATHKTPARPVSLRFKLLMLFSSAVLLPMLVLPLAIYLGASDLSLVYLGVLFLILGAWQVWFINLSINHPLDEMGSAMHKLGDGQLKARMPLRSQDELGTLAAGFNQMAQNLEQAEFIRETFGRYVTQQVMDDILQGNIELGGQTREATILFSDIRGFTSLSETLPPEELVGILNDYLNLMVEAIVEQRGTIDKFIGDAIMATFGAPEAGDNDALRAVQAAINMQKRLHAWNQQRIQQGLPPLHTGIGLHTGPVVAGNIGSQRKMEYTVIGDTVNTASRIESLTKHFGVSILISEATYQRIQGTIAAEALDPVEVKGKSEPVQCYNIPIM